MPEQPIVFEVELETRLGPIRGRIPIERRPMRLAELVPQALALADLLVRRAIEHEARDGRPISCRRGCAACCRHPVPLSMPEVFFVADRVNALAAREQTARVARFRAAEGQLERLGVARIWLGDDYDDARAYDAALELLRRRFDCPFLDEETCAVHPDRPLRCREYNVTSPAAWCSDSERHAVQAVAVGTPLSTPLARLAAERTGTPLRLVPLALALRFTEQHRDLAERTWPGPDLFQGFLDHFY